MQNKLANTKSYLDRHFLKTATDSVEEKRKRSDRRTTEKKIKGKILRMDDSKKRVLEIYYWL